MMMIILLVCYHLPDCILILVSIGPDGKTNRVFEAQVVPFI